MTPLTSPSGCNSCLRLTQKTSELEGRISILYQLKDEERILDSLVTMGPAVTTTIAVELDSTIPCSDVTAAQTADHWTQLGAKPKTQSNKLSILDEEDFPPLTSRHISPSTPESDGPLSPPPLSTAVLHSNIIEKQNA